MTAHRLAYSDITSAINSMYLPGGNTFRII